MTRILSTPGEWPVLARSLPLLHRLQDVIRPTCKLLHQRETSVLQTRLFQVSRVFRNFGSRSDDRRKGSAGFYKLLINVCILEPVNVLNEPSGLFGQIPAKNATSELWFKCSLTSPHAAKTFTLHLRNCMIFTFLLYLLEILKLEFFKCLTRSWLLSEHFNTSTTF